MYLENRFMHHNDSWENTSRFKDCSFDVYDNERFSVFLKDEFVSFSDNFRTIFYIRSDFHSICFSFSVDHFHKCKEASFETFEKRRKLFCQYFMQKDEKRLVFFLVNLTAVKQKSIKFNKFNSLLPVCLFFSKYDLSNMENYSRFNSR